MILRDSDWWKHVLIHFPRPPVGWFLDFPPEIFGLFLTIAFSSRGLEGDEPGVNLMMLLYALQIALRWGLQDVQQKIESSIPRYICRIILRHNPHDSMNGIFLGRDTIMRRAVELYRCWLYVRYAPELACALTATQIVRLWYFVIPEDLWPALTSDFHDDFMDTLWLWQMFQPVSPAEGFIEYFLTWHILCGYIDQLWHDVGNIRGRFTATMQTARETTAQFALMPPPSAEGLRAIEAAGNAARANRPAPGTMQRGRIELRPAGHNPLRHARHHSCPPRLASQAPPAQANEVDQEPLANSPAAAPVKETVQTVDQYVQAEVPLQLKNWVNQTPTAPASSRGRAARAARATAIRNGKSPSTPADPPWLQRSAPIPIPERSHNYANHNHSDQVLSYISISPDSNVCANNADRSSPSTDSPVSNGDGDHFQPFFPLSLSSESNHGVDNTQPRSHFSVSTDSNDGSDDGASDVLDDGSNDIATEENHGMADEGSDDASIANYPSSSDEEVSVDSELAGGAEVTVTLMNNPAIFEAENPAITEAAAFFTESVSTQDSVETDLEHHNITNSDVSNDTSVESQASIVSAPVPQDTPALLPAQDALEDIPFLDLNDGAEELIDLDTGDNQLHDFQQSDGEAEDSGIADLLAPGNVVTTSLLDDPAAFDAANATIGEAASVIAHNVFITAFVDALNGNLSIGDPIEPEAEDLPTATVDHDSTMAENPSSPDSAEVDADTSDLISFEPPSEVITGAVPDNTGLTPIGFSTVGNAMATPSIMDDTSLFHAEIEAMGDFALIHPQNVFMDGRAAILADNTPTEDSAEPDVRNPPSSISVCDLKKT